MQLYGLQHLRLVREPKLDTKCLVAWNEDTLVLAFRGTASRQNAISDIKVGSSCQGAGLGCFDTLLGGPSAAHQGLVITSHDVLSQLLG